MERPRPAPARALLLVLLPLAIASGSLVATAEPERPEGPWRLPAVQAGRSPKAREVMDTALEALAEARWDEAADGLLALRALHPDDLVPVPERWAWDAPLHWPAKHVVELLVEGLPQPVRNRVLAAWRAPVGALLERASRGDEAALVRLGDDWAATAEGRAALRTVAGRDHEAGHYAAAVRRFEHWLRIPYGASPEARASVVLELVDVFAALGDEAALDAVPARFEAELGVFVPTARGRVTLRMAVRKRSSELRGRNMRAARAASTLRELPRDLEVLWTRDHERDGRLLRPSRLRTAMRTLGGAAEDGTDLILHEGGVVRRVEGFTGRELWRFPPADVGRWEFDPRHRYAAQDLPLRTVEVAGDLVLVVLGDSVGTGSFEYLGGQVRIEDHGRESRTRLVALDRESGRLVWSTGRASDTHPVLGDPATGCQSPPLVVGDAVYAVFAHRRGATEVHLARLELATGAVRWVSYLGLGESGRSVDADEGDARFGGERVQAPAWGARPTLAGDEICVLPHAGFVAGVDAGDGDVRWLRVLPRFEGYFAMGPEEGFSARNAPVAHGATWILAPLDCPYLVAIERGSGRWLYAHARESEDGTDPWHHVLGVGAGPSGGPWLRLLYTESGLLRLARPREPARIGPYLDGYLAVGRPLDVGARFVVAGAWTTGTRITDEDLDDTTLPALFALPWDVTKQGRKGSVERWVLDDPGFPRMGDVYAVGETWVVVGRERAGAVAPGTVARAWVRRRLADAKTSPAERAAALALDARLKGDATLAARALLDAAASGDEASVDVALNTVRWLVDRSSRGADRLGRALLDAAPRRGAHVLADLLTGPVFRRRPSELVTLLDRWAARSDGVLIHTMPGVAVRSDLFAGLLLEVLDEDPGASHAMATRERRHATAVTAALDLDEAGLREAIRKAVGTRAARRGRESLAKRLARGGRHAAAAAVLADLRLGAGRIGSERDARSRVADLQRRQAAHLADAGQSRRAFRLLDDLRRWAPAPRRRDEPEHRELARRVAFESAWRPSGAPPTRFDAWRGLDPASDAADLRGVVFPGLIGPGAATRRDRLLVFRGLTTEIWSRDDGARVAAFRDAGAGWFGGSLQEVPAWVDGGGVIVTSLAAGEPADRAGLKAGDWILSWAGEIVAGTSAFMRIAASATPGQPISLDVRRRGRPVLDRLVPGERPGSDGVVVARDELWIDANGRVLVPGRVDVFWIDLEKATKERWWAWDGDGVVHRVDVVGNTAVVTVRRLLEHDALIGLDLATGEERWRRDLAGTVLGVEPTGSALAVRASNPARVYVVDAWDGSVRARVDLQERTAEARPHTLLPARSSVPVHGRVWCITDDVGRGRQLRILNTTTGRTVSEPVEAREREPLIAGDGVVAIALGEQHLRVLAPDPVSGAPTWRVEVPHTQGARQFPFPTPGPDARLFVVGDRLYVLRNARGRQLSVDAIELDMEALGPGEPPGRVPPTRAMRYRARAEVRQGLGSWPYVTDARATPEGLLLSAANTGDRQHRVTFWLCRLGRTQAWQDPVRSDGGGVVQVRRHAPARVGSTLIVPTDEGALFVPLLPGGTTAR